MGEAAAWIDNKTGYGQCRVEVGIVSIKGLAFSLGLFFTPNTRVVTQFKCLADYPPVLAMAEASLAIYDCLRQSAGARPVLEQ